MLLKVLREENPQTSTENARPYTPEEIDFFWEQAQRLPVLLTPNLVAMLSLSGQCRTVGAGPKLGGETVCLYGDRPVAGRRVYCSSRNCLFQGTAADGAILGLWLVWRAGYKLVDFVHDQLVVESPADDKVHERVAHIEALMKEGMLKVIPGMNVQVESVITRSLNKSDIDPRYTTKAAASTFALQPAPVGNSSNVGERLSKAINMAADGDAPTAPSAPASPILLPGIA